MTFEAQKIGFVDNGIDGCEEYVLITNDQDSIDVDAAWKWLLDQSCYSTDRPGGQFCNAVEIIEKPRRKELIGIIYHRFDV